MIDKLKKIRFNITLSALLTLILGIILLFWPGEITVMISKAIAALLILTGAVQLLGAVTSSDRRVLSIAVAAVILLLGLWLFANPGVIVGLIPITLGILLVVHGIQDISLAFERRKYRDRRWWSAVVLGALSVIGGLFGIMNAFGIVKFALRIFGVMLAYDGITDMLIVHRVNKVTGNTIDGRILREEDA